LIAEPTGFSAKNSRSSDPIADGDTITGIVVTVSTNLLTVALSLLRVKATGTENTNISAVDSSEVASESSNDSTSELKFALSTLNPRLQRATSGDAKMEIRSASTTSVVYFSTLSLLIREPLT
jgi:hypothetical protein